jgi:type I restriction enzyme S subunit
MAENLYKEWFVRFRFPGYENAEFENGLPNGWYVEKLGNLCNIITGKKDANQATGNGEYPFFTCARETTLFTDEYILDKNAILISGNGSYTGLVKKYSGKFDLYQRTYALYDFKNIEWLYAYWTLKINFEREFMGGSHGCAIPYITRPNIEKFKVVIPSKDLLLKAQQIFKNIHNECHLLEKQNKNLIKQRDLLLPRLMSGKLEV